MKWLVVIPMLAVILTVGCTQTQKSPISTLKPTYLCGQTNVCGELAINCTDSILKVGGPEDKLIQVMDITNKGSTCLIVYNFTKVNDVTTYRNNTLVTITNLSGTSMTCEVLIENGRVMSPSADWHECKGSYLNKINNP